MQGHGQHRPSGKKSPESRFKDQFKWGKMERHFRIASHRGGWMVLYRRFSRWI
jgi:hypothetical protein